MKCATWTFLIKLLNFATKDGDKRVARHALYLSLCAKNITQTWYAAAFEEQKSATRKSLSEDNEERICLSGDCNVLFRGRFQRIMRDAARHTGGRGNASPKKSIISPVGRAKARAWASERASVEIGAGDLFSDDRGVWARLSHVGSRGSERNVRGLHRLIISYFVWVQRTFRHAPALCSSSLCALYLLHKRLRCWLPAPSRRKRVSRAPPPAIGCAPNRTRSLVKSSRDSRKFPVPLRTPAARS